ncbi:WSC domain-containing protein [Xylaria palmicola]|nr:WSC domain-containing protein [Xylaria palmicola]
MLRKPPPPPLTLLSLILTLTPLAPCTQARSLPNGTSPTSAAPSATPSRPALRIVDGSGTAYAYVGCWNESAGLPGTTGLRALDGASEVLPGAMTVGECLGFCARGAYRLAGLEYARECWCGDELNIFSVPLADAACDNPCDGANATACGGSLKLSLYNSTAPPVDESRAAQRWGERAWAGTLVGTTAILVASFALGGL